MSFPKPHSKVYIHPIFSPTTRFKGLEIAAYQEIFSNLTKMRREEGFECLKRGNGTNVICIILYRASHYTAILVPKEITNETWQV
ncbi:hypothetical protein BX666DRAFT_1977939 [Dichotomocladium elegans]|nr:hypothetical protein BX666DRAFT_1977939 [Dichotomocladium elegans]